MTRNLNTKQSSAVKQYSNETVYTILFFISFAHLLNDLIQGIIPSIYPILKQNYGLTFSEIGLITFAFQLTASILQPFIGYYTDKYPKPYSQVYGMGFTALGIIILSFANNLNWIIVSSIIIGIGSAIFHTESGRISNLASGGKLGLAQSIFQTGGNFGSALAPLAVAFIVIPNSQKYLLWFFIASTIGIGVLSRIANWYKIHLIQKNTKKNIVESKHKLSNNKVKWVIGILLVIIFSKFIYSASLSSFYTFYLIEKFHLSIQQSQFHMFIYLFAYMIGTILGGPLGDKIGRIYIIWFSVFGAAPFALLLPYASLFYTDVLIIIIGFIMASAFPAIIVYAQELVPHKLGMISGLFYGFSFGMAAIGSASLGILADYTSIQYVFLVCSFLPLIGGICYFLPNLNKRQNDNFKEGDLELNIQFNKN
ncbi:MAG: MFS transporter [Flavobacterium sp.]|nr:MFS transporter [Flavobacterium sp.]